MTFQLFEMTYWRFFVKPITCTNFCLIEMYEFDLMRNCIQLQSINKYWILRKYKKCKIQVCHMKSLIELCIFQFMLCYSTNPILWPAFLFWKIVCNRCNYMYNIFTPLCFGDWYRRSFRNALKSSDFCLCSDNMLYLWIKWLISLHVVCWLSILNYIGSRPYSTELNFD